MVLFKFISLLKQKLCHLFKQQQVLKITRKIPVLTKGFLPLHK